jgi:hypothetical protein
MLVLSHESEIAGPSMASTIFPHRDTSLREMASRDRMLTTSLHLSLLGSHGC